jgi:hypothetical protein
VLEEGPFLALFSLFFLSFSPSRQAKNEKKEGKFLSIKTRHKYDVIRYAHRRGGGKMSKRHGVNEKAGKTIPTLVLARRNMAELELCQRKASPGECFFFF